MASLSPDSDRASQVSTSGLGLFLRRGCREITLGQGEPLDNLEEFEALSLKRQRKTMENNLLKVSMDSGSAFSDVLHLSLNVSSAGCGMRLEKHGQPAVCLE